MISKIGKPNLPHENGPHSWTDTHVHAYRPASRDGVHNERPECNYGGYHVWVTNDANEVTCPNCMEINDKKLLDSMRKLGYNEDTTESY